MQGGAIKKTGIGIIANGVDGKGPKSSTSTSVRRPSEAAKTGKTPAKPAANRTPAKPTGNRAPAVRTPSNRAPAAKTPGSQAPVTKPSGNRIPAKPPGNGTPVARTPGNQAPVERKQGNQAPAVRTSQLPSAASQAELQQKNTQNVSNAELNKLGSRREMFVAISLCVFMAALYFVGRQLYDDRYYTPDEGLGYYLGLTGGIMMLLGMAYTAFKYVGALRNRAVMKHWLSIHIYLGIVGPILVMIHSTFHIGSINGGIAFITMLLVFISGIMGRYMYSKTHYGLGGRKAQVKDLHEMLKLAGHKIKSESLDRFTESVLTPKHTLGNAFWDLFTFGWRSRWLYFRLTENMRHLLHQLAQEKGWDRATVREKRREFKTQLRVYILMLKKVALFKVYERFFAFWRNAHVPLIYLLLMSGVMHVIAVHMY